MSYHKIKNDIINSDDKVYVLTKDVRTTIMSHLIKKGENVIICPESMRYFKTDDVELICIHGTHVTVDPKQLEGALVEVPSSDKLEKLADAFFIESETGLELVTTLDALKHPGKLRKARLDGCKVYAAVWSKTDNIPHLKPVGMMNEEGAFIL